jgi:hypothetical protein
MNKGSKPRRLRIVVSDEETGEEVIVATSIETLVLLTAPGAMEDEDGLRVLVGDMEMSVRLLVEILKEVSERLRQGTVMDLTAVMDDHLLVEITEGLPLH